MTREQANAVCDTATSYVEYYAGNYMIVPYEKVQQPNFFNCQPRRK